MWICCVIIEQPSPLVQIDSEILFRLLLWLSFTKLYKLTFVLCSTNRNITIEFHHALAFRNNGQRAFRPAALFVEITDRRCSHRSSWQGIPLACHSASCWSCDPLCRDWSWRTETRFHPSPTQHELHLLA